MGLALEFQDQATRMKWQSIYDKLEFIMKAHYPNENLRKYTGQFTIKQAEELFTRNLQKYMNWHEIW
jgi:hypothetical protein